MFIYAFGVSAILFLGWFYVWERLIQTAGLAEPVRQLLLGFFVVGYLLQASRWALYKVKGDLSWLIGPAYFSFGLLSHLFLATLAKDLLSLVWWGISADTYLRWDDTVNPWMSYLIFFGCFALSLWGAQSAYEGPELKEVDIDTGHGVTQTPLRVVQLSDIHVGPIIKKTYIEDVVRRVNELEADVICITGDLGDGMPEHLTEDLLPLSKMKSRMGVYYVTGNHEYYWNINGWIRAVKALGMKVLFNDGELLPTEKRPVWLGGVPDISAWRIRPDHTHSPEQAAVGAPANAYKILLAHQPRSCFTAEKAGFDLMLSGHTHGGQYLPFTWIVHWFNPFSQGLGRLNALQVYVNVGTGFWGPPLRLGVMSEITLLKIHL